LAASVLLQALWLESREPLPVEARQPVAALTAGLAFAAGILWRTRAQWDPHLDMLILMAGPGGLGMIAGVAVSGAPSCHFLAPLSFPWSLMTAGMLVCSLPPSWLAARCVLQARVEGWGPLRLLVDSAGMLLGMTAASQIPGWAGAPGGGAWLGHGVMVLGMLLGSGAALAVTLGIRSAARAFAPWQRKPSKLF
jgi:hypothetical protein